MRMHQIPTWSAPPHPFRSIVAETGAAPAWPVGRMPLAVAFAHGADGSDLIPDGRGGGTAGPVERLGAWSCGRLSAAVGGGSRWVINIQLPPEAMPPSSLTGLEYGLCAYVGLRLDGHADRFLPALCAVGDPRCEPLDVTVNAGHPMPFRTYVECYWRAVAADLLARSGVTRPHHLPIAIASTMVSQAQVMARFRRRYPRVLTALRTAGGVIEAKPFSAYHARQLAEYEATARALLSDARSEESSEEAPVVADATGRTRQHIVERCIVRFFPSFCNENAETVDDLRKLESQLRGILAFCGGVRIAPFLQLLLKNAAEQIRDAFPGVTQSQREMALTGVVTALRYDTEAPEDGEPATWYVLAQHVVADRLTAIDRAVWRAIAVRQLANAGLEAEACQAAADTVIAEAYRTQVLSTEAIAEMRRRAEAYAVLLEGIGK